MLRYTLRSFDADDRMICAATLRCEDESAARRRLEGLPRCGDRLELWRGERRIAIRTWQAPPERRVVARS